MNYEKEITVSINCSKEELIKVLENNHYRKINSYLVDDIYYVLESTNLDLNPLEILKNAIIVRSIDDKKHYLMYKYKEYDQNENIINEGKSLVQVLKREEAKSFLETINYKELIRVVDKIDVYEKDGLEILIEDVNDKYLFVEIETNEKYDTIDKLMKVLYNIKIDYDKTNYYAKKAKIIFEENYR